MGKIKKRMVSVMAAALIVPVVFTMPSVASADGLFSGTASGQEEKEDHVVTINGTEKTYAATNTIILSNFTK